MKTKKLSLLLIVVMVVTTLFSGCSDAPTKEKNGDSSESTQTETNETFALNDTAVFKNMKITAKQFTEFEGDEYFEPEDGNVFVGVEFEIENTSDEDINISSMLNFNAYADDVKIDYSINASVASGNDGIDGTISSGKKLIGWYSMEVPEDYEQIEVQFVSDAFDSSEESAPFIFTK